LSSLQLAGIPFFDASFFLSAFSAASSEGALAFFLSSFFSSTFLSYLGSVNVILN
jgi:hypothetical protein